MDLTEHIKVAIPIAGYVCVAIREEVSNAASTLVSQPGSSFLLQGPDIPVAVWPGVSWAGAGAGWKPACPIPAGIDKQGGKEQRPRASHPNYLLVLNASRESNLSLTYLIRLLTSVFHMGGFLLKARCFPYLIRRLRQTLDTKEPQKLRAMKS